MADKQQQPQKRPSQKQDRIVEKQSREISERSADEKPISRFPDSGKASVPEGQGDNKGESS